MQQLQKTKTIVTFFWSFIDKVGQQILHFIVSIIIARKLLPNDYGLIGMINIFLAFSSTFIDSGLGEALIQKKNPCSKDYGSVFIYNIVVGLLLYSILYFIAPIIANFYHQPQLIIITRTISLSIIFSSISFIRLTYLMKTIDFKTQFIINIVASTISGILGIYMAYSDFGVWTLVYQMIINSFIRLCLLFIIVKLPFKIIFDLENFRSLFKFSSNLLVSWILNQLFSNIYSVIIGKKYNSNILGYYTQGRRLQEIPVNTINSIFQSVSYPILAKINNINKEDDLRLVYKKVIKMVVSLNFPLMILLIITSKPLILVLLTSKWASTIEYFRLFCLIGFIYPLTAINLNITKVLNNTKLYLRLIIIKRTIFLIFLLATFNYGVKAIIIGQVIASYLGCILEMKYSGVLIKYKLLEQVLDIAKSGWNSLLIGTMVAIPMLFIDNNLTLIMMQISIFFICFVLINFFLRTDIYLELKGQLSK